MMGVEDKATAMESPSIAFDDDAIEAFVLKEDETSVGRTRENALCVSDPEVSRRHARFLKRGDTVVLEDLGSSNGTFVNGELISGEVTLRDGDRIAFGGMQAIFHTPPTPDRIPLNAIP